MKRYKYLFCDFDGTLVDTLSGKTFPEGIWDMKVKFDVLDKIKGEAKRQAEENACKIENDFDENLRKENKKWMKKNS